MINQEKLKESLTQYKLIFNNRWSDERFKWEAIKCFQDNWDINADNFAEMFLSSTAKTCGLLASMNNFPRRMIQAYAEFNPEEVRKMFNNLYDESLPVIDRIIAFQEKSQQLCDEYTPERQHYQRPMAITVYLWLRYPSKYDVFKYSVCKGTSQFLENTFMPKKGDTINNIKGNMELIDEILTAVKVDEELLGMYKSKLDEKCYKDESYRTLAFDISFYIANFLNDAEISNNKWTAEDYNPGITKEQWLDLLNDEEVFTKESLEILARMHDIGGQASCVELSEKYGESSNFYNRGTSALGKRIAEKTHCPLYVGDDGKEWYFTVMFLGRNAFGDERGSYVWKLRDELAKALDEADLEGVELYKDYPDISADIEAYTKEDFLSEVYMDEGKYNSLVNVLLKKKNIILQGAPGVGKTFAAERLAFSIMGVKDKERVEFVQFHQNYSYEDFIMGYKPTGDGFELRTGIFYDFCKKADENPNLQYFFIIDEINRGNLSKIFGELLMLIENGYRNKTAILPYNGQPFSVPENLYIIGMMNTADRSLAMIDYALRRRFSFFNMEPGFTTEGFKKYQAGLNSECFNELIDAITSLNNHICDDDSLGSGFMIGHSYFCGQKPCSDDDMYAWMSSVVEYDIIPMLEEYWFDNRDKVRQWRNTLNGVLSNS